MPAIFAGCSIVLTFLVAIVPLFFNRYRLDIDILRLAGVHLWHGQPVYGPLVQMAENTKPPFLNFLFMILAGVPGPWVWAATDALNIAVYALLLHTMLQRAQANAAKRNRVPVQLALGLALFLMLNSWQRELRFGQYNLMGLALVYACSRLRAPWNGATAALAVLLKPTNVILLPWVFFQTEPKARGRFLSSGIAAVGILALAYGLVFGPSQFVEDHRAWLETARMSYEGHALLAVNLGLPRVLSRLGLPSPLGGNLYILLGVALAGWASWRWKRAPLTSLGLSALILLVVSPMAWFHNYCILLPWVVALIHARTLRTQLSLGVLFLTTTILYSQALLPHPWFEGSQELAVPMWGLIASASLVLPLQSGKEAC